MTSLQVPIGPQHPLLKEPLSIVLDISGERVTGARVSIGYVHRGIERLCETRTYTQCVALVERICGICSHAHTTAFCQAVEALHGTEAPPRARYLRVLFCELERIHSHLLWLGVLAEAIGFTTIFMYAWRDREPFLEIMEEVSGGRVAHAANVIGGVRIDVEPQTAESVLRRLANSHERMQLFRQVVERDRSFHRRTRGVGDLDRADVKRLGIVGPVARSAGSDYDVRIAAPYAAYRELEMCAMYAEGGDVWTRAQVRLDEIEQSLGLCEHVLGHLPAGPLIVELPRRVPEGQVVMRCEAPRGELLYYVRSNGSDRPARVKVRTPTLPLLMALEEQLPGLETADVSAVVAGADLCVACADR